MQAAQRFFRFVAPALFVACAAAAAWLSIERPFHNWDMIGYIASAKSLEESDIRVVHAFTFDAVRRNVAPAEYEDLAREKAPGPGRGGPYRHAVSTDPQVLQEQLPFYQIRPLYTGSIYLLYKAGVDIAAATYLICGAAIALSMLVLYLTAVSRINAFLLVLLPLLAWPLGAYELARFSTADGMAFLAVVTIAYLYLSGRIRLLLALSVLMLGIRTDLILFSAPLLLALFIRDNSNRIIVAIAALTSATVYASIVHHWRHPGWKSLFACSLVTEFRCIHPATQPPDLSIQEYGTAVLVGLHGLARDPAFMTYLGLLAIAAWSLRKTAWNSLDKSAAILIAVCMSYIGMRFLILPAEWERCFPAPYLITALCVLRLVSSRLTVFRDRPSRLAI